MNWTCAVKLSGLHLHRLALSSRPKMRPATIPQFPFVGLALVLIYCTVLSRRLYYGSSDVYDHSCSLAQIL